MRLVLLLLFPFGDHPREYGENGPDGWDRVSRAGPSPRIRGEFHDGAAIVAVFGTIPANTGRITATPWMGIGASDHPREYGENVTHFVDSKGGLGPSPRIRGELVSTPWVGRWTGTIPANTGRIRCRVVYPEAGRDHPREYGENLR